MVGITLSLDKEELKKIITHSIELEYQRKVVSVQFNVHMTGDERGGGSWPTFTDVEVKLGDKLVHPYAGQR